MTRAARLSLARDAGARKDAERSHGAEADHARDAEIEAARLGQTVEPKCSFRPHLTDDDVFECTKVLFNDPSLGSKEADPANPEQPPPWPINYTSPKADVPSHLRQEENRCRRANVVDFTAGAHDRPYTLSREGRKKSFTPASAREEFHGARSGGRSGDDRRGGAGGDAGGTGAAATAASAASNASNTAVARLGSSESVYGITARSCAPSCTCTSAAARSCKPGFANSPRRIAKRSAATRRSPRAAIDLETRFQNYPLMELLTPETRHYAAWRFRNREPKAFYSGDSLKRRYLNGERAFIKSSEAMGFCDDVDAPCVYLTVLREPVARFMSYYSYICLLGAEGHEHWPEEWVREGRCSLNPLEFYEEIAKGGFSMIDLLAPGGDHSGKTRCRVEAAKKNLESKCVRFALLERMDHSMQMMRKTMPDLAAVGLSERDPLLTPADLGQNGSGDRLSPAAKGGWTTTRRTRT